MSPDWPIETERLLLRPFEPGDFGPLHELYADEDVVRWLYEGPASEEASRKRLERKVAERELTDVSGLHAAVTLRDGAFAGDVVLWFTSFEHRTAELGFSFLPRLHGNGYATEAAHRVVAWAFAHGDVHRIVGRTEARNVASVRVLEKLGLRREAHFVENEWVKGEWQSEFVYAILKREWPR